MAYGLCSPSEEETERPIDVEESFMSERTLDREIFGNDPDEGINLDMRIILASCSPKCVVARTGEARIKGSMFTLPQATLRLVSASQNQDIR